MSTTRRLAVSQHAGGEDPSDLLFASVPTPNHNSNES